MATGVKGAIMKETVLHVFIMEKYFYPLAI
jgi:hypothetical protein